MADAGGVHGEEHLAPWTRELLGCLTPREREAFALRETGLTFAEIATTLDVSPSRASDLYATAASKMTEAARRATTLARHASDLQAHVRPGSACLAERCRVPDTMRSVLDLPLTALPLGVRALNCLEQSNIRHVGALVARTEGELLRIMNFGRITLREVSEILAGLKLHLGMDIGNWVAPCAGPSLPPRVEDDRPDKRQD